MRKSRRGPDFERSDDQRVVIGPYEPSTRPDPAPRGEPTLLQRLRARITGRAPKVERGPGFKQPDDVPRLGRYRRQEKRSGKRRRRPTGFVEPGA